MLLIRQQRRTAVRSNRLVHRTESFRAVKQQFLDEVSQILKIKAMNRVDLSERMTLQPSAITQLLDPEKGIQLTSIVRVAEALNCDVEINLILR